MKRFTRIISSLLALILAVGALPVCASATHEDTSLVKRSLRVYSSVDQQRHDVQVTEQNGKIYINATDLTTLLQGGVYLWQKKTGFHTFIESGNEFTDLLKQGFQLVGVSTDAPYYYILQNGITKQNLRYNLTNGKWTYFSTASNQAAEIHDMPELAPPIVENDIVYVELLPFAKALGIIVNIAAEEDGISFHVPTATLDSLAGIVDEIFNPDNGIILPWRENESFGEALKTETALYIDQVFDICSGEAIPFITGNYDADRFEEAMIAVLSVYGEETADYVSELWDGIEYTRDIIDTPAGLMMLAEMDNGYVEYLASLNTDAKLKELIQTDSPGISGMESATGLLLDIYSRQLCLTGMVTANVEAANNVFNGSTCWVPEEVLSLSGKTTGDIVRTLVDEYYHGISGKTVKKAVLKTTVEIILGQYGAAAPEVLSSEAIKNLPIFERLLDISSFGLSQALSSLNVSGIALQAYESFSGYQYGTLHQIAAYRELQDILLYGYINCLNSPTADVASQAQYIYDCAKLAFLAKLAFSSYLGNKSSTLLESLLSINPQEVALSVPENIDALSGATDEAIRPLIFDNVSYEFDFWDFADALGMDPYRTDGTIGIGNSIIADLDSDGYPEYLLCVHDTVLYPTPFYVVLDADAGRVAVDTTYNDFGLSAFTFPKFNPDTGHVLLHTQIATYSYMADIYRQWNEHYFEDYVCEETRNTGAALATSYREGYESISEYRYNTLIANYDSTPYTSNIGEVGSDHLQNAVTIVDVLHRTVPIVRNDAMSGQENPSQVFKVDGVYFNHDRSIVNINCSWATTWDAKQTQEFWWDPYACYYVDIESGEILRIIIPDGPPVLEDETWLADHGFTE